MYRNHNEILTDSEKGKVGKDVSTPIAFFPTFRINIQYQFDNTYSDIWEYKAAFSNINFQNYIGDKCLICGAESCFKPIRAYYRYAIELFPHKKEKVPVARFVCRNTGQTFSLLPRQLIPYCQYTVDAVVGTLLNVYQFQQSGQVGFYGASLELDPDCSVTPYLIQTWAVLLLYGFLRSHHVFYTKFPMPHMPDPRKAVAAVYLYLQSIGNTDCPNRTSVIPAIRYYFHQTRKCLFGKTSCDRNRSP